MSSNGGVVIVGGGLAAARTAEQLRRADYTGPVTIVSDETRLPYDRPPLSKEVLRNEVDDVTLRPAEFYADNQIDVRLGTAARSVDTVTRTVTLGDGTRLGYDELVIATGLVPKRISSLPALDGIRVLRSYDESMALRAHAAVARRAAVIGAGFIGCEVAASLRRLGVDVVLVEPQPAPLASVLGERIGSLVARMHRAEGVDVRCGVGVAAVTGAATAATSNTGAATAATSNTRATTAATSNTRAGSVQQVQLSDGTRFDADLVVVGVGSYPATGWLDGSGIQVDNGVVCDGFGRASAPHVWAIGDVASWRNAVGQQVRVEHWSNVAEQARVLVPALLGERPPAAVTVPYFWSDQYDVKIQCLGEPAAEDVVHLVEDDGRRFLAYFERDGVLTAVVGAGMPGKVMKTRAKIAAGAPITDVLAGGQNSREAVERARAQRLL